jgi:NADPH2:quinone reductase
MRALVFDAPAPDTTTTRIGEFPIPKPGPGAVSIHVTHAGVNFKDVMARRGDPGYVPHWPFVPGLEVAGSIRAVGAGVSELNIGQPVAAFTGAGGLAEVAIADARLTVPIPHGLFPERAAAAPGALLTAALLIGEVGRLRAGETLLVHSAAGGVGTAAAQLARLAGAELLLGTVGDARRADAARHGGYDTVLARQPDLVAAIRAATDGHGVDLILDPQGTALLDIDLDVAAPGARIILFGNATGTPLAALPPLGQLMAANVSLAGFSLAALAATDPARLATTLRRVLDQLAVGALDLDLTVLDGLDAAPDAQQDLADGSGHTKFVIDVTS